ncbi:MAG: metallophosphoesterase [candidate division WOR-3 bacterium]|nr:metallophosphoesterase [candidate division WOR-3 bacterium]
MKILHTADIHLKNYKDENWETLQSLIQIGRKEEIDIFVISGDLFDKKGSSVELYPKLRPILNENDFDVIILPGNHDEDAFGLRKFFGDRVKIIRDLLEPIEYDSVRIFGMPFKKTGSSEVRSEIRKITDISEDDKVNILLFHGELLDHSFTRDDYGPEEGRYMGVRLSYFENLNLKYILAGHFHTNFQIYEFPPESYFIYPGSPISITKKETGKRSINLFEVGKSPKQYHIISPYYEKIEIVLSPSSEKEPVKMIEEEVGKIPKEAKVLLSVKGYTERDEEEIHKEIKEFVKKEGRIELEDSLRGIKNILEDELFKSFNERLKGLNQPREEEIRKLFIEGMIQVSLE